MHPGPGGVRPRVRPVLALIGKLKAVGFADSVRIILNWARALQGLTPDTVSLSDEGIDEREYVERYRENPLFTGDPWRAQAAALLSLRRLDQAPEAARRARAANQLAGTIWPVEFHFWNGLTLAATMPRPTRTRGPSPTGDGGGARLARGAGGELPGELPLPVAAPLGGDRSGHRPSAGGTGALRAGHRVRRGDRPAPAPGAGQRAVRAVLVGAGPARRSRSLSGRGPPGVRALGGGGEVAAFDHLPAAGVAIPADLTPRPAASISRP